MKPIKKLRGLLPKQLAAHRIFWKIFASFWLANLVIMLATTYVLLHHSEAEHYRDEYKRGVSLVVEHLLADDTQKEYSIRDARRILRRMIRGPRDKEFVIHIYENGESISKFESRQDLPEPDFIFDLTLMDGREVQVHTLTPHLPKMLLDIMKKVHKLHLAFMFLGSALVSVFLSWNITRPLEQLGRVSRGYALEREVGVDKKLLNRGDEIGALARDLDKMMHTVTNTMSTQKQLLHDVSHELRAPLARLQVAAELIQQKDPGGNPHIQRIHEECERIDQLIQRILSFSRLEQVAVFSDFDLSDLVKKLIVSSQYENPNRAMDFKAAHAPLVIHARKELVEQGIENIFRNACKYSAPDSTIEVELNKTEAYARLVIRDHGPGVDESELEKLRLPFYRAGQQMHGSGFGLGLSIAHRAIDAHGGMLAFANHPGGGLQVTVLLPLDKLSA